MPHHEPDEQRRRRDPHGDGKQAQLGAEYPVRGAPPSHDGDHPRDLEERVRGMGDDVPDLTCAVGPGDLERVRSADAGGGVLDGPDRRHQRAGHSHHQDHDPDPPPTARQEGPLGEAQDGPGRCGQDQGQRPDAEPSPPGGRGPRIVESHLPAEEQGTLQNPDHPEQQRFALARPHQEHPRRDGPERERQQAVVQVGQPEAVGEPGGHQRHDRAEDQQGRTRVQDTLPVASHVAIVADGGSHTYRVNPESPGGRASQGYPRSG